MPLSEQAQRAWIAKDQARQRQELRDKRRRKRPLLTAEEKKRRKQAREELMTRLAEAPIHEAAKIFGIPGCTHPSELAVNIIYRGLANKYHPDKGGSAAMMIRLNAARQLLLTTLTETA